ncbi:hypothetical protein BpHYR1_037315 [Brachionus plicatilis]|uniref:Uncharacterized protein n=1 Tax=Brachionus plicatilis TaxID=10195 RepID=A0A3M7RY25_BRAPC|nr:hypothetical protein BpHYR1_037315 [Brachionus plicatilis]
MVVFGINFQIGVQELYQVWLQNGRCFEIFIRYFALCMELNNLMLTMQSSTESSLMLSSKMM